MAAKPPGKSPVFDLLTFDTWDYFEVAESPSCNLPRSVHVTTAVNVSLAFSKILCCDRKNRLFRSNSRDPQLLGAFEKLRSLRHKSLLQYVDICRTARERIIVVQEHCRASAKIPKFDDVHVALLLFKELVLTVGFLHQHEIICTNISPRTVCCSSSAFSNVPNAFSFQLMNYGLLHLKCNGLSIESLGDPRYLAPELLDEPDLLLCPSFVDWQNHSAADVWSLALTIVYFLSNQEPFTLVTAPATDAVQPDSNTLSKQFLRTVLTLGADESLLDKLNISNEVWSKQLRGDDRLVKLLRKCLFRDPVLRPTIIDIKLVLEVCCDFVTTVAVRSESAVALQFLPGNTSSNLLMLPDAGEKIRAKSAVDELYLDEIYYLWKVSGGNAVRESISCNNEKSDEFTILSIPLVTHSEFSTCRSPDSSKVSAMRGSSSNRYCGAASIVTLDVERLRSKLDELPHAFYPIFARLGESRSRIYETINAERSSNPMNGATTQRKKSSVLKQSKSLSLDFDAAMCSSLALPIVIRERNVFYTYYRVVLFRHILESFPYSDDLLWTEANADIPPLYRGACYAALLGIRCNMNYMFDLIDKESPTSADRQIEVDVPRCHQYEPLLSSPAAHGKFKRILRAWVRTSYPHYVYWQGLDSLCAPFLYLNFNDEALAFECLRRFIDKYLAGFFIYDNTDVIHEYLAVFQHLVAFHDPQLAYHLHCIGFQAELFAIPWFLTCFAHILPLDKVFLLWDALLLADSTFPLFIGLALLRFLRTKLLNLGFNECILLFSDLPDVDVEKIRADAWQFFHTTPKSVVVRNLDLTLLPPAAAPNNDNKTIHRDFSSVVTTDMPHRKNETRKLRSRSVSLAMASGLTSKVVPVETLRAEVCPRIVIDDLLLSPDYEEYVGASSLPYSALKRIRSGKLPPLVIIDIRSQEDYDRGGSLACSLNVPADELPLAAESNETIFKQRTSSSGSATALAESNAALRAAAHLRALRQFDGKLMVVLDSTEKRAAEFGIKLLSYNFPYVCVLHDGIEGCRGRGLLGVVQSN